MLHAIKLVEDAIKSGIGGEIIVPKLKSFNIKDLIEAITGKKNYFDIVGIRPGEKIHEELISQAEAKNTLEFKDHYRIYPNLNKKQLLSVKKKMKCKILDLNFSYNSGTNPNFMKLNEIKKLITDFNKNDILN